MSAARSIGLAAGDRGELSGTIDENIVLASLATLADEHPGNDDVFAEAVTRVRLARSAGVEHLGPQTVFNRSHTATTAQLRYRTEMADVFTDLAIDIGIREARRLADLPA